ncbi:MAG TPA: metallophosphoesterase [Chryseosolibacter sp.]|nr:metallophosphoesterase [Chryseosolibacter sp.]
MRKFIRFLLYKPVLWIVENFSSAPDRQRVFSSLSKLRKKVEATGGQKGFAIPFDANLGKFIIFSDQHKGRKNGADDFALAEPVYIAALEHYNTRDFHLISLGDSEELWENTLLQVKKHNTASFAAESRFAVRGGFTKIFGNHDLDWEIDPLAAVYLKEIYGVPVVALEAVMLQTIVGGQLLNFFCTHGHQGDLQSDGNWLSKFFVSKIWAPLQAYLRINPNTPAYDASLKTAHNTMMYEWSAHERNLVLITGHTHQPVFESLTHIERLQRAQKAALYEHNKEWAEAIDLEIAWSSRRHDVVREDYLRMRPTYFNTGCCCYDDGDITGIEIAEGVISLVKWESVDGRAVRSVLEQKKLGDLVRDISLPDIKISDSTAGRTGSSRNY